MEWVASHDSNFSMWVWSKVSEKWGDISFAFVSGVMLSCSYPCTDLNQIDIWFPNSNCIIVVGPVHHGFGGG